MHELLLARQFDQSEVAVEIDRLESVGLLRRRAARRDARAQPCVSARGSAERRWPPNSSVARCDPDAIEAALIAETDDDLDRAIAIAERRAPQLRSYDAETAKRRLGAFLMRKGYTGSVVATAVARALEPGGTRSG